MHIANGDLLREQVRAKSPLYTQLDSTFQIELAYVAHWTGEGGEKAMEAALLNSLPDGKAP